MQISKASVGRMWAVHQEEKGREGVARKKNAIEHHLFSHSSWLRLGSTRTAPQYTQLRLQSRLLHFKVELCLRQVGLGPDI